MLIPGICSVTFKTNTPEQVLHFAVENKLQAIEWWGADHVPAGDVATARRIGNLTRQAGVAVSSYGSYYRTAVSEEQGAPFIAVLDSAEALGAATIRVWAGNVNFEKAEKDFIARVVDDTLRIADLAQQRGLSITFEFHGGTFTNSNSNAQCFVALVAHPNVFFSWQPPHGFALQHCIDGLNGLLPRLSTLHVYHWTIGSYKKNLFNESRRELNYPEDYHRHPLKDGRDRWIAYLALARTSGRDHYALLEFVKDDAIAQAKEDAAELVVLCR